MIADIILTLGMLLSPASQLRPEGGGPVGPGEICFVAWLCVAFVRSLGRADYVFSRGLVRLVTFWLMFAVALCFGTLTAYVTGLHNETAQLKHDVLAYMLAAAIGIFCLFDPAAVTRLRRMAWSLVVLGAGLLLLQLAHAAALFDIDGLEPWSWDRFCGWSRNPNQLALVCVVLSLVSFHLAETAGRGREKIAALVCALVPLVAGWMTKSDSFLLVVVVAVPLFTALKVRKWMGSSGSLSPVRPLLAWFAILLLPGMLILAVPAVQLVTASESAIEKHLAEATEVAATEDAPVRFKLWKQALEIGLTSSLFGLGPGPHVKWETRRSEPEFGHPSKDTAPVREAHNVLLDLFTQGGVIAVLSFCWLFASTWLSTVKAKHDALAVLLCGLAIFGMFHLIVRHPLFWFVIVLCLVLEVSSRRRPGVTVQS